MMDRKTINSVIVSAIIIILIIVINAVKLR
jgi:hypothetical protein